MISDRLGTILIEAGKLTEEQLAKAAAAQRGSDRLLGEVLQELGYVTAEDTARALSVQLGIPFHELGEDFRLEKEEVKLIPESIARRFCVIPIRKNNEPTITIVMKDPLDLHAVDTIRSLTSLHVQKAVSTEERIKAVIDRYYREEAHIERNLKDIVDTEVEDMVRDFESSAVNPEQLRILANDVPVVRFVNLLLMQAVRDRASDIHFEPGEKTVTVRLRIDGLLREVTPPPKALYPGIVSRIKILSNMDISERRLPLDGRFKFTVRDRIIDIRVSSLPEYHGEKLVLRVLDRASLLVNMKDVGFDADMLERFQRILRLPNGIVLLTGPTGSGKTTTLYSALNFLKSPSVNIQTVEDPVEYLIPGINQMSIKPQIGLDFADSLRSILRQDPDIIMIGEIRDLQTAQIAMRAALTGHLVLSTLHTNDAPSAFWRLRDIGIEPYLIAATIKLVISQRLVRILCQHCKKEEPPSRETVEIAKQGDPNAAAWHYFKPVGCPKCNRTGYRGRIGIFEFLEVTDAIREMILNGTGTVALREKAIELGMDPLLVNGLRKVEQGMATAEEVISVAPPPELR